MARNYDDKLVLCPYFVRQDPSRIHCEGWTDIARTTIITAFDDADGRRAYSRRYCCDQYTTCCLYRLTDRKYDDTTP